MFYFWWAERFGNRYRILNFIFTLQLYKGKLIALSYYYQPKTEHNKASYRKAAHVFLFYQAVTSENWSPVISEKSISRKEWITYSFAYTNKPQKRKRSHFVNIRNYFNKAFLFWWSQRTDFFWLCKFLSLCIAGKSILISRSISNLNCWPKFNFQFITRRLY